MKYLPWLLYSIIALGIAYIIPLLTVGEEIEARDDYFKSFEAAEINDLSQIQNEKDLESLKLALVGVEVQQGSNGRKDWQLNANWLSYGGGSGDLFANSPELLYFDKSKKEPFRATSKIGRVIENNNKVEMQENVVLKQDTITLSSPFLNFDTKKEIFSLSQGVQVKSPELHGRANRITWDTKGNSIQADGRVVFIFNPKDSKYNLNSPIRKAPIPKDKEKK